MLANPPGLILTTGKNKDAIIVSSKTDACCSANMRMRVNRMGLFRGMFVLMMVATVALCFYLLRRKILPNRTPMPPRGLMYAVAGACVMLVGVYMLFIWRLSY